MTIAAIATYISYAACIYAILIAPKDALDSFKQLRNLRFSRYLMYADNFTFKDNASYID